MIDAATFQGLTGFLPTSPDAPRPCQTAIPATTVAWARGNGSTHRDPLCATKKIVTTWWIPGRRKTLTWAVCPRTAACSGCPGATTA